MGQDTPMVDGSSRLCPTLLKVLCLVRSMPRDEGVLYSCRACLTIVGRRVTHPEAGDDSCLIDWLSNCGNGGEQDVTADGSKAAHSSCAGRWPMQLGSGRALTRATTTWQC